VSRDSRVECNNPERVQQELPEEAIVHVASRSGIPLVSRDRVKAHMPLSLFGLQ
jgi:hypothetical protein